MMGLCGCRRGECFHARHPNLSMQRECRQGVTSMTKLEVAFVEDENGQDVIASVTFPGGAAFDIIRPIEVAERNGDLIVIYEVVPASTE